MMTSGFIPDTPDWQVDGDAESPHLMGSVDHAADTLANLNTKVSDATLIDTTDPRLTDARTPTAHDLAGAEHSADTLAHLNSKVSDATLIDTTDARLSDARTPTAHNLGGAEHSADTLANLNLKVSDATLIDTGDSRLSDARTPTALANMRTTHGTESDTDANENGAFKRTDLTQVIDGADSEGVLFRITTGVLGSLDFINLEVNYT